MFVLVARGVLSTKWEEHKINKYPPPPLISCQNSKCFFFTEYHKTTNLDYLDAAINFNQFSLLKTDKQQELYKLESKLGHMPKF